ncbi:MAG: HD domain-containing phosphohydrolase [Oscillospiraceae bacterium]
MIEPDIAYLLDIGIALSREKDKDKLFELILISAMDLTNCDGGTLYRNTGSALAFKLMFTRSNGTAKGGRFGEITLPPVPLTHFNVCSCAALDSKLINVANVYESELYDFSGPRNYDAITGYKTESMLVVPMEDDCGKCIGVLQLINAMDANGNTVPFAPEYERIILSLASQTAICQTNVNYADEVREMLNSFVRVMSTAIDARTPYNANHTRNMVIYGQRFLDWLKESNQKWQFTQDDRQQFIMSIWLHDVGKLTIPLSVMDKESRLGPAIERVMARLRTISLLDEIEFLKGNISKEEYERKTTACEEAKMLIADANKAGYLPDASLNKITELAKNKYKDENGEEHTWLTDDELTAMLVQKGTLTGAEREIMESHVVMTRKMLDEIHFPKNYLKVAKWAVLHHELVNGTGYPNHLNGQEIPKEVRLLTILDIFDALTARDRPYKPPMPVEKALVILDSMVDEGKLDGEIVALFKESHAWEV